MEIWNEDIREDKPEDVMLVVDSPPPVLSRFLRCALFSSPQAPAWLWIIHKPRLVSRKASPFPR